MYNHTKSKFIKIYNNLVSNSVQEEHLLQVFDLTSEKSSGMETLGMSSRTGNGWGEGG